MITAVLPQTTDPIPAVLQQLWIPSLGYYRQLCPHYRGNPIVPITMQLTRINLINLLSISWN